LRLNIAPCAHLDPHGLDTRRRQTGKRISATAITTRAAAITLGVALSGFTLACNTSPSRFPVLSFPHSI